MKWKHVFRYPFDICTANRLLSSDAQHRINPKHSVIGLDLYTDQLLFDCGRHLACLAAHAAKIDSIVVLRCSRLMLAAIAHKSLGQRFLSMPNVRWSAPAQPFPSGSLILTDIDRAQSRRKLAGQKTVVMMIGRDRVQQTLAMPYPMHPNQIGGLTEQRIESLRTQPKAGVFFAGNQKDRYGREGLQNGFGVLPRLQILSALRQEFPDRIAARASEGACDRIVLRNSATDPIDAGQWMSVVAGHQFFLCCPGASQPVCHNVIEAMAVGTIPILEYADRMPSGLRDGVNAVFFRGRAGLINAIARIDLMDSQERENVSQNTCRYFDDHLDGAKFLRCLRDDSKIDSIDSLSMPFHDRNLFAPDSPPSGRAADALVAADSTTRAA